MMLNAIEEIRNEMNHTSEYKGLAMAEPSHKRQKSELTVGYPKKQKIEQKAKQLEDELENVNKLMKKYVSIDDGHESYKGPEHRAIEIIFTYLACTEGLGFSAVAILETVFEASIKTLTQKIQEKMAT